jgi:selenocysteine lyase/cysteine desulfurase
MSKFIADRGVIFERERRYEHVCDDLRGVLAWLINGTPQEIALVQNIGEGLSIITNALPLQSGDNILFCDRESPHNIYPWRYLQQQRVEARHVPHSRGESTVKAVDRYADNRTRVVAVSSVDWMTGFKNDLQALGEWCREHELYFIVDGTQSLGVTSLDVQACQIDFLTCGGHTWLMGPPGQGFIYYRQELLDDLLPSFAGHMSVLGGECWHSYDPPILPDVCRFEPGCANTAGQVGLLAAVRFLMEIGIAAIERQTLHLTDLLIKEMQQRGYEIVSSVQPKHRSAIVTFSIPGDTDKGLRLLTDARVVISKHKQYIRVSPHCYNTDEEIALVGEVLGNAP